MFPAAKPACLDLLSKMLVFNPKKRFTIKQCLEHKWFDGVYNMDDNKSPIKPFDWSVDNFEPDLKILQSKIYDISLKYHPEKEIKLHDRRQGLKSNFNQMDHHKQTKKEHEVLKERKNERQNIIKEKVSQSQEHVDVPRQKVVQK